MSFRKRISEQVSSIKLSVKDSIERYIGKKEAKTIASESVSDELKNNKVSKNDLPDDDIFSDHFFFGDLDRSDPIYFAPESNFPEESKILLAAEKTLIGLMITAAAVIGGHSAANEDAGFDDLKASAMEASASIHEGISSVVAYLSNKHIDGNFKYGYSITAEPPTEQQAESANEVSSLQALKNHIDHLIFGNEADHGIDEGGYNLPIQPIDNEALYSVVTGDDVNEISDSKWGNIDKFSYDINLMSVTEEYMAEMRETEGKVLDKNGMHKGYRDPVKIPTIGYGHAYNYEGKEITMDLRLTEDEAIRLFNEDIVIYEQIVKDAVAEGIELNQGQFNALVDFAFNKGEKNLRNSTLLKKVNNNELASVGAQFGRWIYADKKVFEGLVKRAAANKAEFESYNDKDVRFYVTAIEKKGNSVQKEIKPIEKKINTISLNENASYEQTQTWLEDVNNTALAKFGLLQEYVDFINEKIADLTQKSEAHKENIAKVEFSGQLDKHDLSLAMHSKALLSDLEAKIDALSEIATPIALELKGAQKQIVNIGHANQILATIEPDREDPDRLMKMAEVSKRLSEALNQDSYGFTVISEKNLETLKAQVAQFGENAEQNLASLEQKTQRMAYASPSQ